jgi:hypothetical protein
MTPDIWNPKTEELMSSWDITLRTGEVIMAARVDTRSVPIITTDPNPVALDPSLRITTSNGSIRTIYKSGLQSAKLASTQQ